MYIVINILYIFAVTRINSIARTSCFFRRDAAELLWSLINLIGLPGAPSGSGSTAGVSRHLGTRKLRMSLCLGTAVSWLTCLCRWGTRLPELDGTIQQSVI
jgi:hypothetical protein